MVMNQEAVPTTENKVCYICSECSAYLYGDRTGVISHGICPTCKEVMWEEYLISKFGGSNGKEIINPRSKSGKV